MAKKTLKKRKPTLLEVIEKKYGKDTGVRSTKEISDFLEEKGYHSLSEMLKRTAKNGRSTAS